MHKGDKKSCKNLSRFSKTDCIHFLSESFSFYRRLYHSILYDGTEGNNSTESIGCPKDCEYREDEIDLAEYNDNQRTSAFPWLKQEKVFVKLVSSRVTVEQVLRHKVRL